MLREPCRRGSTFCQASRMTSHSVLNSAAEAATCVFPSGLFELNWGGFNVSQIVFISRHIFWANCFFWWIGFSLFWCCEPQPPLTTTPNYSLVQFISANLSVKPFKRQACVSKSAVKCCKLMAVLINVLEWSVWLVFFLPPSCTLEIPLKEALMLLVVMTLGT